MAETMMPQVNLGAGTVLADTLFPQETAGETLRKQELAKRKNIRNRIKKRDHEQMETHADRLAAAGSVVGIPVCVHDLSYRKKYYQQFLSG